MAGKCSLHFLVFLVIDTDQLVEMVGAFLVISRLHLFLQKIERIRHWHARQQMLLRQSGKAKIGRPNSADGCICRTICCSNAQPEHIQGCPMLHHLNAPRRNTLGPFPEVGQLLMSGDLNLTCARFIEWFASLQRALQRAKLAASSCSKIFAVGSLCRH